MTITELTEAISALQQEIAAEYQAARADGFDAATARLMVGPRHGDLADARRNIDRLTAVQTALVGPDGGGGNVDTDMGREHLPDPRIAAKLDDAGKQAVLDVLDVTVHVTCPTCHGTGY